MHALRALRRPCCAVLARTLNHTPASESSLWEFVRIGTGGMLRRPGTTYRRTLARTHKVPKNGSATISTSIPAGKPT
jgi:hypothetical protein